MKKTAIYPNRDDWKSNFWNKNYKILVTAQGIEFRVNADCTSDAIDYVIDYSENHLPRLVTSYSELKEDDYTDTEIDDYICGGNAGLYLTTHNILVEVV